MGWGVVGRLEGGALTLLFLRDMLQKTEGRGTSVRIRFGSPFSSKTVGRDTVL